MASGPRSVAVDAVLGCVRDPTRLDHPVAGLDAQPGGTGRRRCDAEPAERVGADGLAAPPGWSEAGYLHRRRAGRHDLAEQHGAGAVRDNLDLDADRIVV